MKATILYTIARIGVFVVPFALLLLTPMSPYLSACVAAAIGFLLSYILLPRLRYGFADAIVRRRVAPERDDDADAEDAALDAPAAPVAPTAPTVRAARTTPTAPAAPTARRGGPPSEDD